VRLLPTKYNHDQSTIDHPFTMSMANSKFKLTYFDWTGLAETTRYMFAYAKVPYEDERIPMEGNIPMMSPELKAKYPWGQVPVLEVDGKQLAQNRAINRFLAKQFGLAGANDFEAAKCDELVDSFMDYVTEFQGYFRESDADKKKELMKNILEVTTPKFLGKFDKILEDNGGLYLVGKSLTWTDFQVHHLLKYFEEFCKISLYNNYPALKKGMENFYNIPQIKNWVATRPKPALAFSEEVFQELLKNLKVTK